MLVSKGREKYCSPPVLGGGLEAEGQLFDDGGWCLVPLISVSCWVINAEQLPKHSVRSPEGDRAVQRVGEPVYVRSRLYYYPLCTSAAANCNCCSRGIIICNQ